ncbi:MAG: hypothetical protein WCO78_02770 [Candidatus Roizmanbacteria bacterium]
MSTQPPTRELILSILGKQGQARVHDLATEISIGKVALHRQLKSLLADGLIQKHGSAPLVFYVLSREPVQIAPLPDLSEAQRRAIEREFLMITPDGKVLPGIEGFTYWAGVYAKSKNPTEVAAEYVRRVEDVQKLKTIDGCIDATIKIAQTFPDSPIERMLFADVYSLPTFGRSKLARLVTHAKNAPDPLLISMIVAIIRPLITQIVTTEKIDAVGYIPPTVPRPVQFVSELTRSLALALPHLDLVKVMPGDIAIPQKSLSTTAERMLNARQSIYPRAPLAPQYRNILLIDDVVGSGASFQETAMKLKAQSDHPIRIIAFALVGNLKGYDVVRQI